MGIRTSVFHALAAASVLMCAVAASAQTPTNQDLIGTWNLTLTSPQGSHPTTVVIKEDGGQLVGELTGLPTVGGLKVATSEAGVRMTFAVDYQGQPVDVVMVGKLTGAEMKGTVDYAGGAAAGDFQGTKGAAAAGSPTSAGVSNAGPASLTGTWVLASSGGTGWSMDLTQDGSAVTGTLKNTDQGISLPLKGTLDNGTLDLAVMGDMTGTIKGKVEGPALKGNFDVSGETGTWSATRKP
jgi:hypothetical protein